jgi:Cytochrome P460
VKKELKPFVIGFTVAALFSACVNHEFRDVSTSVNTSESLFTELNAGGYQYYQNGGTLSPASASTHGSFRLRFNGIAASSLDNSGELPLGNTFKDGSILVKEVYRNNILSLYAIMKKAPLDPTAANGWLWAEYALDGTAVYSISQKGAGCTNCHSETPNRDFVRTFDFH